MHCPKHFLEPFFIGLLGIHQRRSLNQAKLHPSKSSRKLHPTIKPKIQNSNTVSQDGKSEIITRYENILMSTPERLENSLGLNCLVPSS
jgi:hypothetical protein